MMDEHKVYGPAADRGTSVEMTASIAKFEQSIADLRVEAGPINAELTQDLRQRFIEGLRAIISTLEQPPDPKIQAALARFRSVPYPHVNSPSGQGVLRDIPPPAQSSEDTKSLASITPAKVERIKDSFSKERSAVSKPHVQTPGLPSPGCPNEPFSLDAVLANVSQLPASLFPIEPVEPQPVDRLVYQQVVAPIDDIGHTSFEPFVIDTGLGGSLPSPEETIKALFAGLPVDPRARLEAVPALYSAIRKQAAKELQPGVVALVQQAARLDWEQMVHLSKVVNQALSVAQLAIRDPVTSFPASLSPTRPRPRANYWLRLQDHWRGPSGSLKKVRLDQLPPDSVIELIPIVPEAEPNQQVEPPSEPSR